MTSLPIRTAAAVLAAGALAVTVTGCDAINNVRSAASNISTLSDIADKLKDTQNLTYTAEYQTADAKKVTLVQQPPNTAYVGPTGRMISTPTATFLCDQARSDCQKGPGVANSTQSNADAVAMIAGNGFISPGVAVGLVGAAALVPGAKVSTSERTIAGQPSTCAKVTGLEKVQASADPSVAPSDVVRDFTVCITEKGILGSFSGSLADGNSASAEMTSYSGSADASSFQPPAGYSITPVQQIQPR